MKKLLFSIGSIVAVIAPIAISVSCGNTPSSSKGSDKNTTGTNVNQNTNVQANHKYPELTDSLRNEILVDSQNPLGIIQKYYDSKGRRAYFDQFNTHTHDVDFDSKYIVFQPGPNEWFAPYHEVYDFLHSSWPEKYPYLDN